MPEPNRSSGLLSRESGLALIEDAQRWERAYRRERDRIYALHGRAQTEPLETDISDYSDEFCAGFLAGQFHVLDLLYAHPARELSVDENQIKHGEFWA